MRFLKFIIPLLVLAGSFYVAKYLLATGPQAKKKPFVRSLPIVEVMPLKETDYKVTIKASGTVRAGIQTNLVAEVAGRILDVSDKFLEGNYFNKNHELMSIDNATYENAIAIAQSDVAASKASLAQLQEEEKSIKRSLYLAKKNLNLGQKEAQRLRGLWAKKLIARTILDSEDQKINQLQQKLEDLQGRLNGFASRKAAIQAKTNASLSRLKQERLKLDKTIIRAPYTGRVLNKKVDAGQFVGTGTVLGKIYATDFVYVDLPLSLANYELLGLPESFQNQKPKSSEYPEVIFTNPSATDDSYWKGRVVRTSAALDADSRQIKVIAKINKPFMKGATNHVPIRVGQYLNAKITGKTFHHVYSLAPATVRQNKEIMLLKNNKVHIVPVQVLWNSGKETVIRSSEKIVDELLITTVMSQATEGMSVIRVEDQRKKLNKKEQLKQQKRQNKKEQEGKASE